ncbi:MAG: hypothetical protein P8J51_02640 [Dehalococcoidia bacterium]|nr:hypothetical protein [Dehalococcoidia bacterium]
MGFKKIIVAVSFFSIVVLGCASEEPTSPRVNNVTKTAQTTSIPVQNQTTTPTKQRLTKQTLTSSSEPLSLLVSPFMDPVDYWGVQPFAVQENQLGIQFHNGLDYFTNQKEVALQAISDGQVMFVQIFERPPDGAFQINLAWQIPNGQIIVYSLEPSAGPANATKIAEQKTLANKMLQSMTIKAGDTVRQGQLIGYLYGQDEWAHVHMSLKKNNRGSEEWLCPAEFMTTVKSSDLVSKSQNWADRLYKGSKKPKLCNY